MRETAGDRVKRFIESKDWKLFCVLGASVIVAGAGVYYLSSSSSAPKTPDKEESSGRRGRGTSSDINQSAVLGNFENMPAETIAKLSPTQRSEAAQSLKSRGNSMFGKKKWTEAAQLYTKAIEFKADPIYYSNRAACYANLGDNGRVFDDCNSALQLNPVYIKALNRRAHALELRGDLETALYDYTCVCILENFNNEVAARSMERLMKKVSERKAAEIMKTKQPRLPSSTFVSAYFDSYRSDLSRAEPVASSENIGDSRFVEACEAIKSRNYEKAYKACDQAIELGLSPAYQAHALNIKGTFKFLMGNAKEALACFDKSIEIDPKYIQSYIKRSSIYIEQGNLAAAIKQFEDALAINPTDPDIYYHRGQVNYISGNYENAAKDYSKSISLDDSFVYAHIQLGVAQYKLGRIAAAMSTFQDDALKLFPQSSEVHNYFGELLIEQQNLPQALEMFTKAIALDQSSPLPYINKAMLTYQVMREPDEAIRLCKIALQVDPACDAAVASLAQILLEQGKPEEALKYYETAIDLARTETEIEHAISYVEATKAQIRFAQDYPQQAAASLSKMRGGH
ncbi:hypothetical protein BDB00DRAFT_869402 [Zychaea mexicana]|uniref:uncharacterized protein n=1 Tax=Zychaea mexicana TaxID=64656 RepID=UPI0022FDFA9D|nr:uncharacterized protein BDB00DRAFT_869402 [Zychaea mexicana]KAI9496461.1 hypothetical protein BDB00DRAFT_869402 [Zychaea mexicana]